MHNANYGHDFNYNIGLPVALETGLKLALAAAQFPGELYQRGLDTAYDLGSSLVPERISARFNRMIGNRPTYSGMKNGVPFQTWKYDGISGFLNNPDGTHSYVLPHQRVQWSEPGVIMRNPPSLGRYKLPVVPSHVYQAKNAINMANIGMNRLFYDKHSLYNKLKELRHGSSQQFTRRAAFYNRKVQLSRGPVTRGQKRNLRANFMKAPRRKRKRGYKRV